MRRGSCAVALASALTSFVVADAASAQQAPAKGPAQSSSQFTLRREEAGGADGTIARSRARAGDCAGAMPAFDAAVERTIEPTLRRDRGLCHEKLGHAYPAIDDYRAYLTARPEANDADQIRERLARLEEQTGQGGPSAASVKEGSSSSGGSASASASTSGSATADKDYDAYLAQERLADAAETSPLRYGSGWIVGPFVQIPTKWFSLGGGFGPNPTGYALGATFRYATGPMFTVVTELGYAGIGTQGEVTAQSGVLTYLGFELRFPFSKYASDQIFTGAGVGFQRFVVGDTANGADIVPLRGRLGYRHVFGPSIGLDIGADVGVGIVDVPDGGSAQFFKTASVGGAVAFLVAF